MMKWIDCNKRLPETQQECLVAFIPGDLEMGYAYALATFCQGKWHPFDHKQSLNGLTHWMPLPSPPKD